MTDDEVLNRLEAGEALSVEELLTIPIFKGVPQTLLEKNRGAVALRHFPKGSVICREADQGSTAFYILKGRAQVSIKSPLAHFKTRSEARSRFGIRGLISRMTSFFAKSDEATGPVGSTSFIPIDAPVDLPMENPVGFLEAGDLFGEMTCLSFYPRSATVVAEEDSEMLEMLQNILTICQRNPVFKKKLDEVYRERSLVTHLRQVPLFATLDESFLQELKTKVEFTRLEPGTVVFSEGDPADALYLVRLGFVRVTRTLPGGQMVLSYLSRGSYFGEMGLLQKGEDGSAGRRTATCTALDHVELVKIKGEDFARMMASFPEVAKSVRETAAGRESTNRYLMNVPRDVSLDSFLDQGLIQAQNLLILDLEKCTRCDACTEACAATHDGVTRLIREGIRYDHYLVATSCRQCMDPLCMVGCPVGSIRRRDSLEIIIEDWCIGCGLCSKNCPYGNINMHPYEALEEDKHEPGAKKAVMKKKAVTCDLCTELEEPSCVYACPHEAAQRVDPKDFFGFKEKM